jgi:hypothetical protein
VADEATISCQLTIQKGHLQYTSLPASYTETVNGTKGPTPGAITASIEGTFIDLSQLTRPGLCVFINLDTTNFVTLGVYDGGNFFPVIELRPGKPQRVRLSRYVNQEFVGTGTGTNTDVNRLMLLADTADCVVRVDGFED